MSPFLTCILLPTHATVIEDDSVQSCRFLADTLKQESPTLECTEWTVVAFFLTDWWQTSTRGAAGGDLQSTKSLCVPLTASRCRVCPEATWRSASERIHDAEASLNKAASVCTERIAPHGELCLEAKVPKKKKITWLYCLKQWTL